MIQFSKSSLKASLVQLKSNYLKGSLGNPIDSSVRVKSISRQFSKSQTNQKAVQLESSYPVDSLAKVKSQSQVT